MRLTQREIQTITRIISKRFGQNAVVTLFGSRVDDQKKGGDIDLLVEANLSTEEMFQKKLEALCDLKCALGEQKIDLITATPIETGDVPAVVLIAREKGIQL